MAKITIDESACVSCGLCANLCPEVFEMNAEGIAIVLSNESETCDIKDIASQCPVDAIVVE
ncbi:MAG: ferredoxin [Candidatus Omnitrophica bacterium]|nr:ferredoxin [Candidatus Omnitrophota bacterium]MCK5393617.1 ferredoxin [Candidatus Omnitrophota bacterium]MCK5492242.1 ferredoxin [Candidatus Omnitrophota bacterium]